MVLVVVEYAVDEVILSPSEHVRSISMTLPVPIVFTIKNTVLAS